MKRGDIRWYEFKSPDKNRPVLILTRNSVIQYMGEVTIAPITKTIRNIPSEVILSPDDGMLRECAINCDHLQTVSKARLGARITTLTQHQMKQVQEALTFALGFE